MLEIPLVKMCTNFKLCKKETNRGEIILTVPEKNVSLYEQIRNFWKTIIEVK